MKQDCAMKSTWSVGEEIWPVHTDSHQAFNTIAQYDSKIMVRISEAVQNDSAAMKTIAVLTLTFLPATFVSVGRLDSPYVCPPAANGKIGTLQYDVLQLFARERSSSRGLGGFQEDLDILGDLTSLDDRYDFILAHVAEKVQ